MKLYAKKGPSVEPSAVPVSPGGSTMVFRVEEGSPPRSRTNSTEADALHAVSFGLEF